MLPLLLMPILLVGVVFFDFNAVAIAVRTMVVCMALAGLFTGVHLLTGLARQIGNIMYTKSRLTDESGREKEIVTFGPVCIAPEYQRKGYGKQLIGHSLARAEALGYEAVVIFGSLVNYVGSGFVSCRKHNICAEDGKYPAAMLVKELVPGALDGRKWIYRDSPVMAVSEQEAREYDDKLEKLEKKHLPSQEEFYIMSRSFLE